VLLKNPSRVSNVAVCFSRNCRSSKLDGLGRLATGIGPPPLGQIITEADGENITAGRNMTAAAMSNSTWTR
jgi:hypothetical protein